VRPYRSRIKWDPADDLCLAAELFVQPYPAKDWLISGKLFEIEYREPLTENGNIGNIATIYSALPH